MGRKIQMKKRHQAGKKIAAWLMALSLCMTAVPAEQVVYAAGGQNETEVTELTELTEVPESAEAMKDSETTEKTGAGEKADAARCAREYAAHADCAAGPAGGALERLFAAPRAGGGAHAG